MAIKPLQIRVSIDRGGTFTDVHAAIPGRDDIVLKLLSVDPANYKDAPTEGIRRVLELVNHIPEANYLTSSILNLFAWVPPSLQMPY